MKIATVHLRSVSPYSQSRFHEVPKLDKERPGDYEERTWRNKAHTDNKGRIQIPPTALKNALNEAAKYLAMQIPGKGKATFTKHIEAGILCIDPITLPVKSEDVRGNVLFLNSDGKVGGGSRVKRIFPTVDEWEGEATFHILDETVTKEVFEKHIKAAGQFIGIGQFRPRNRGYFGRFDATVTKWE